MRRQFFLLLLLPFIAQIAQCQGWTATFSEPEIEIHMHTTETVGLTLTDLNYEQIIQNKAQLHVRSDNNLLAEVDKVISYAEISPQGYWNGSFEINAIFLGRPNIFIELVNSDNTTEQSQEKLAVTIIRENRAIDHIFTGSVAVLVSILYINFGAALDLSKIRGIVRRPIGPVIGFCCQFIVMPLLGFGLALLIFPQNTEMQLGMFFTGVSPAGGASNIWTIILGGNMDLSITMTSISTFAAFGMMPLWIFTLGKVIFDQGDMEVPYFNLATYVISLVIPLGIGILIQWYLPRVRNILVRILKPCSSLLILFIIIFAIVTNLYLFELFSWQVAVAGLGLPWIGYVFGFVLATLFKQSKPDRLAIALETGIQNTGISIFLLRFALPQPAADLTTVVPVAVAIMTPVPLLALYIYQKIRSFLASRKSEKLINEEVKSNNNGSIEHLS